MATRDVSNDLRHNALQLRESRYLANGFNYNFDWDPAKAVRNRRKHGISFELAATVFRDPLMLSIPDEEHDEIERRSLTLGQAENGKLLVVIHNYREMSANTANVRIVSTRAATKHELRQYEDGA